MADDNIVEEVASVISKASTQALDLSFNELLDMSESGELNIAPDYQRLFRWSEGQRSRFIESLILEMPVPPIFVVEEDEGKYQLIDGLQRISSYLHLRGKLSAPHMDPPVTAGEMLVFSECDIVKSLNGKTFNNLPTAIQIRLKRAFIRVEVIRKGTDPKFKYHMFKRLNTGGDLLSDQQLRNCAVRMLNSAFPNFINSMAEADPFKACTVALTQERRLSAFDQELVLRFFALKNRRDKFKHDVSDFLTSYMEEVAEGLEPFSYRDEEAVFIKTFQLLQSSLNEFSFSFAKKDKTGFTSGFSALHYEAITLGLQSVIDRLSPTDPAQIAKLAETLKAIKTDGEFIRLTTGGGKNSTGQLRDRIAHVERELNNAFPS